MNTTKRYLLQLKAQFEREGKQRKLLGMVWLSAQQRYDILQELMMPLADKDVR